MSYYIVGGLPYSDELYHWGVNGMKWYVRRYQNKDGSLTAEGRRHYGVSDATKNRVKNAVKAVGSQAAKAAKSATTYTAKRTKMRHPEFMSDDELRNYTQRLIAEKNYSDLLRYQRANSGFGKAKAYVGDIIKRGGNTMADAVFRRIANKISKTRGERELENLQRENSIQALKDKFEDRVIQREIDQARQQNTLNDLRDQLNDADGAQAQKKELERLQRENQLADLRNKLDPTRLDQQKQIDDLNQKKTLRDLEKQLNSSQNDGNVSAALAIMRNPDAYSSADRDKAQQILKNYSAAISMVRNITGNKDYVPDLSNPSLSFANSANSGASDNNGLGNADAGERWFPSQYSYDQTRYHAEGIPGAQIQNTPRDFSNYRMTPIDGSGGGMYGGRVSDSKMPTVEKMSNPYQGPAPSSKPISTTRYANNSNRFSDEDWYRMFLENAKTGAVRRDL